MSWRSLTACAATLLLVSTLAAAQTPSTGESVEPEPWNEDEFAPWLVDTRRAEVIALGAFPVAVLVNGLVYQLGRFTYVSVERGEVATDVAPWFFRTEPGDRYTLDEQRGLLISAAVVSVAIATIDYLIGRRSDRRSRR